jgi:hypothetical protein
MHACVDREVGNRNIVSTVVGGLLIFAASSEHISLADLCNENLRGIIVNGLLIYLIPVFVGWLLD